MPGPRVAAFNLPLAATVVSWGFNFVAQERLTLRWLLGAGVAFGGVAIVQLAGAQAGHGRLIGNLLVLGSAALWALSTVAARSLLKRYDPVQLLTLAMPGAFVAAIPYGLAPALAVNWAQLSLT
ncbi:MAG: DMT family transporter, partial [Fimbriimonas ginsengisoli]|nr:DMT family transporter [Fimbriimonas ginsengisoli]